MDRKNGCRKKRNSVARESGVKRVCDGKWALLGRMQQGDCSRLKSVTIRVQRKGVWMDAMERSMEKERKIGRMDEWIKE